MPIRDFFHTSIPQRAFLCLGITLLLGLGTAVAGESVHEERAMSQPFDAIKSEGSVDVELIQGPVARVTVDAPAKLLQSIRTSVENGTLVIDSGNMHMLQFGSWHGPMMRVTVTMPSLRKITINGSGDLHADRFSSAGELVLELHGSGDLEIAQISVAKLTTEIAGSSDVEVGGSASEQSVRIAGSGDYNAENLKTGSAAVSIAGSGDASVWASTSLSVQIAGSGDVSYWGNPTLAQSVIGSGEITHQTNKS